MSLKLDLHVHSKRSGDSRSEPEDIIVWAVKKGLDGIAIVDHGTVKGALEAARLAKGQGFLVIPGAEIKTDQGEVIGYFLNEEIRARGFEEVVDEMRSQDAVIALPHPYDPLRRNRIRSPELASKAVDAVEVYNARCLLESWNRKALSLARDEGLGYTAGSDAHHLEEIGAAGVVVKGDRLREEISSNKEFFGERSSVLLHARASLKRLLPR